MKTGLRHRLDSLCHPCSGAHLALALFLFVLGTAVRLYRLGDESLWLDEHITWSNIELPTLRAYIAELRTRDATFVPAYYALLHGWARLTAFNVLAARLLSVILGMGAAVLAYAFARVRFGPAAGIVSLAFMALSNPLVYYTQEVRVYALYLFAAVLSMITLFPALQKRRWCAWTVHQLANVTLVCTHYFGALFVLSEGLLVLGVARTSWRRATLWFAVQGVAALGLGLWMLGIDRDVLEMTTAFLQPPQWANIEYAFIWTALYWPRSLYCCAGATRISLVLIAGFMLYCILKRNENGGARERLRAAALCLSCLIIPTFLIIAATYLLRPVISLRYMLPAAAPFFMLVGGAVQALPERRLRWGCVCAIIALLCWQLFEEGRPYRPDMRRAGTIIANHGQEGDALLLMGNIDYDTQRRYLPHPHGLTFRCPGGESLVETISRLRQEHGRVWVVSIFDYGRGYPSHLETEAALSEAFASFERFEASADHYTFMSNSNWPALSDVARRVLLYRIENVPVAPATEDL